MNKLRREIRRIILEYFGLIEAEKKPHASDRLRERFLTIPNEDISLKEKERILNNLKVIEQHSFREDKSFAIMLGEFLPNPDSIYYVNGYYLIPNPDDLFTNSTGNQFWCIIRENKIFTIFLRKREQTQDAQKNANDLKVNYSFKNIGKALAFKE